METIRLTTDVAEDGRIHIDAPTGLPPGPAEVVVVVQSVLGADEPIEWSDVYGIDKALWQGINAQEYVNRLRDEWER